MEFPSDVPAGSLLEAGRGALSYITGLTGWLRKFVRQNEEIIVAAVLLLVLCDCEDDTELLLAIGIFIALYFAK